MYLVRSWPRLSQTFVVDEVLAQEQLGTRVELFSLTRSDEQLVQPQVRHVRAEVHYLDERRPRGRRAALGDHARVACAKIARQLAAGRGPVPAPPDRAAAVLAVLRKGAACLDG